MFRKLSEARAELALANRIAANEGVLDTLGHVSMRHPDNPQRYFLSRSSAPDMVTAEGLIEYDLDSQPARDPGVAQYSERVIHGEIYKARPDVMSVCHHHSPSFLPLIATRTDYVPITHMGAVGGIKPPWWDQHDEFGDTNMLVARPEEGASLARALGSHWLVLMNRHGVTVAGVSVRDCVYRAIQTCRNAEQQVRAMSIGTVNILSQGEMQLAAEIPKRTTALTRSWDYWALRVAKAGASPKMQRAGSAKTAAKPRRRGGVRRR
ncbi:MAG TPA: class II aldolase/adducin family protein [Pseudolabrys sp.]|nr:class II aldolase/adducin family protein [Pseudolabrys sp.]